MELSRGAFVTHNVHLVYNESRYTGGTFDGLANKSLVMKATYSVHR